MTSYLFEILVPTVENENGVPYSLNYHKTWDKAVRAISGGLTIMATVRGEWASLVMPSEILVIPVRILCTSEQIAEIARMTMDYYDQETVMYYRVADMVTMIHKTHHVSFPSKFADDMDKVYGRFPPYPYG